MKSRLGASIAGVSLWLGMGLPGIAQTWVDARGPLDPARNLGSIAPEPHRLLREEYIWTAGDAAALRDRGTFVAHAQNEKIEPHYFRATFTLREVPRSATFYVAGPRSVKLYINGIEAAVLQCHPQYPIVFEALHADVGRFLHAGKNVIAIEAVRGLGLSHHTNSMLTAQLNMGEVLTAKIIAEAPGVDRPPLFWTSSDWRSTLGLQDGWQKSEFDDSSWMRVQSLGAIESQPDFFQWNSDAGMYNWPGYLGISSYLRRYHMLPETVSATTARGAQFRNVDALTRLHNPSRRDEFTVDAGKTGATEPPGLVLDFGREVAGSVTVESDTDRPLEIRLSYGESLDELREAPFLGTQTVLVAPGSEGRGAKSAFRYALVKFPVADGVIRLRRIALDGVFYPVSYEASFESSDPLLNRIWEIGAYTAHLCMQDGVWDAPKRDRGQWMGDMDVTARVIDGVFADRFLIEDTFKRLAGPEPITQQINSMAPYTAFWVIGQAAHYDHAGSIESVRTFREQLVGLLKLMDKEVNADGIFDNPDRGALFVDWAPGFDHDTPEARRAIQFEFALAFSEGARLLRVIGDTALADHYEQRHTQMVMAAQNLLLDRSTLTFGPTWQSNAIAIVSNSTTPAQDAAISAKVLSQVGHGDAEAQRITPYYGYYVLEALSRLGRTDQALKWTRQYWGGMVDEGATSFWEAYDPRWPKQNPHASLQADNKTGYYVSMAHGWSTGPTLWLQEHVLGVRLLAPGGREISIHPDLGGLKWAHGTVPLGNGLLHVDITNIEPFIVKIELPPGVLATVDVPVQSRRSMVVVNGKHYENAIDIGDGRKRVVLNREGHYTIEEISTDNSR